MNHLLHLRSLVAALNAQAPDEPLVLDDFEILAAENPKGQPRERLTYLSVTLRSLAERLGGLTATDDVVAVLQDVATATAAVDAELASRPDPAAVAASLLAGINADPGAPSTGAQTTAVPRPPLGRVAAPARPRSRRAVVAAVRATADVDSLVAIGERVHRALTAGGDRRGVSQLITTLTTEFPPERTLTADAAANEEKLEQVAGVAALTAAGGVCGPIAVDYSIPEFASIERPLRDGLVRFGADRGGVSFNPTPSIADLAGATVVWTEANDVAPAAPATKPVVTVACPDVETVLVDAIPTRVRFGNMQQRFNPELIASQVQTALAGAARIAELNLLAKLDAASTEVLSTAYLGAVRDLLATVDLVCAALRFRQRIPRTTAMRVVFAEFARDMLRADMARQLATDASETAGGALAVSDAEVDGWFGVRGIRPIWTLDGRPAGGGTGRTYPLQGFGAQVAGGLDGWPAKVVFNVFPEGSFVFLDGGRLDLGVVRDSTLNDTNQAEMFVEPFENVAFRGVEAVKVVAPIAPNGGSAGTIATSTYTAGA